MTETFEGVIEPACSPFVGDDGADLRSPKYEAPGRRTDGTTFGFALEIADDVRLDLEREAVGALARG